MVVNGNTNAAATTLTLLVQSVSTSYLKLLEKCEGQQLEPAMVY